MSYNNVIVSDMLTNDNRIDNALKLLKNGYDLRVNLKYSNDLKDNVKSILDTKQTMDFHNFTLTRNHPYNDDILDIFLFKGSCSEVNHIFSNLPLVLSKNKIILLLRVILINYTIIRWRSPWIDISKDLIK